MYDVFVSGEILSNTMHVKVGDVINGVMDEALPPHLAVMDRATPKYRLHRGKQDDKMDKAVQAGMQGDAQFAEVKVDI